MPQGSAVIPGEDGSDVPDDVVVTHVGRVDRRRRGNIRVEHLFSFRSSVRVDRNEPGMSVIAGKLPIEEAVPYVCRGDAAGTADAVRYALTEDLRKEKFEVKYRESRTVPGHVTVSWLEGEWTEEVLSRFDRCFREYVRVSDHE